MKEISKAMKEIENKDSIENHLNGFNLVIVTLTIRDSYQ